MPARQLQKRPRVALLIESSRVYGRGMLHGIAEYVRVHGPWSIYWEERGLSDESPAWLQGWKGDGVIARVENLRIANALRRLRVPVVDVRMLRINKRWPTVFTDDEAVTRLAFEHLRERGFRHYAYCGFTGLDYSEKRQGYFVRFVDKDGLTCSVYHSSGSLSAGATEARERQELAFEADVAKWVYRLPKPVGLMACNDIRGQQVLNACREVGVAVPDEVAVIGVDNDEVLCDLAEPPLSSIQQDTRRIGYEAAALLDQMMTSGNRRAPDRTVPPIGVVTRRSTDVLAIADADISAAMRLIRDHACDRISVADLLASVPVSHSGLLRRFRKFFGRTPKEEILRVQLGRVQQLLAETTWPLKEIAARTGFSHVEYLCAAFKKKLGQTPSEFRRQRSC